jgi:hypothetical protein
MRVILIVMALLVAGLSATTASAQSWGVWNRIGNQTAREYGEPCWSAALSKCTREQHGVITRGRGTLARKRVTPGEKS